MVLLAGRGGAGGGGGEEVRHLGFKLAGQQKAPADRTADRHGERETDGGGVDVGGGGVPLDDLGLEAAVVVREGGKVGGNMVPDALCGGGAGGGVGEQGERGLRAEGVDVGVNFLDVEEDAREWGGEIEGCVGGIVGRGDEGVGEGGGGEGWVEEGFVVDVGGLRVGHGGGMGWGVGCGCGTRLCRRQRVD